MSFWDFMKGGGKHDDPFASSGIAKKLHKWTDPLVWIGGDKYANLTDNILPREVNRIGAQIIKPFDNFDRQINPLRKWKPVAQVSDWVRDKPGTAIGLVAGAIAGGGAIGSAMGGAAGGAGTITGGSGLSATGGSGLSLLGGSGGAGGISASTGSGMSLIGGASGSSASGLYGGASGGLAGASSGGFGAIGEGLGSSLGGSSAGGIDWMQGAQNLQKVLGQNEQQQQRQSLPTMQQSGAQAQTPLTYGSLLEARKRGLM